MRFRQYVRRLTVFCISARFGVVVAGQTSAVSDIAVRPETFVLAYAATSVRSVGPSAAAPAVAADALLVEAAGWVFVWAALLQPFLQRWARRTAGGLRQSAWPTRPVYQALPARVRATARGDKTRGLRCRSQWHRVCIFLGASDILQTP